MVAVAFPGLVVAAGSCDQRVARSALAVIVLAFVAYGLLLLWWKVTGY